MPPSVPSEADVMAVLRGVVDPELGSDIVDLGMVNGVEVADDGIVLVTVALTISGCPLRVQIREDVESKVRGLAGVTAVAVKFGEMTQQQRSEVMQRARKKAADNAPETEVPLTTRVLAVASGKGGVGKSSVTVNLASALAARGFTVGVLDADIWGFSVPRMLGVEGRLGAGDDGKIIPHEIPVGAGRIKVVSMGFLVDDEETAIMWRGLLLAKAFQEFLVKVAWGPSGPLSGKPGPSGPLSGKPGPSGPMSGKPGPSGPMSGKPGPSGPPSGGPGPTGSLLGAPQGGIDYLLIDMPPGTGDVQMALGRILPRAEMLIVTTPALAAQKVASRVADMARRSYLKVLGVIENMSTFTCDHGDVYPLFGSGGGLTLATDLNVPLVGQVPLEPAVSAANDDGAPLSVAAPESGAGAVFAAVADRIADELLPPIDMAGCTARVMAAVESAFG